VAGVLSAEGAKNIRRLFPATGDKALSSIYVFDISTADKGRRLIKLLDASKDVEFVEGEVRRKLVEKQGRSAFKAG
jgi:hypothetical protein